MLGLAVGDALASKVEFLDPEQIEERYGPGGIRDYPDGRGLFTDDTQLSIAVAEALVEAGDRGLDELMAAVSCRFVSWLDSPDNHRAPGRATRGACKRLKDGLPWTCSGDKASKGGSAMRTAPVGYHCRKDPARLRLFGARLGVSDADLGGNPTYLQISRLIY